jgi:hypothetical protein
MNVLVSAAAAAASCPGASAGCGTARWFEKYWKKQGAARQ